MIFMQAIEGRYVEDLNWGTSAAKPITISFWISGSNTGTYTLVVQNYAQTRSYLATFTVPASLTYVNITVPGDVIGTWVSGTNAGAMLVGISVGSGATYSSGTSNSWLGSNYSNVTGSTQFVAISGNVLNITCFQVETGNTATPYETRPFGQELVLCQRYCYSPITASTSTVFGSGAFTSTTAAFAAVYFPQVMRSSPAFTSSGSFAYSTGTSVLSVSGSLAGAALSPYSGFVSGTVAGATSGLPAILQNQSASAAQLIFSAEL
jgi:hypothetical protein